MVLCMYIIKVKFLSVLSSVMGILLFALFSYAEELGTLQNPIIHSNMTWRTAITKRIGLPVPLHILNSQTLMFVIYYSTDFKIHKGQLLIDKRLTDDIRDVFETAFREKFPIHSVIPISHPRFQWDDDKSMVANNTSAFNYRNVAGSRSLSKHAYGFAIDINPLYNPYIKNKVTLPIGAKYIQHRPGTLTRKSSVVKTFLRLGWVWGGDWKTLKDYQHFAKVP